MLIALSIYAMFPVLKNTYTGLLGVEKQYLEAAWGCGMTPMQTLLQVELPLAMPNIIGGLRLSTVYTVSWAKMCIRDSHRHHTVRHRRTAHIRPAGSARA